MDQAFSSLNLLDGFQTPSEKKTPSSVSVLYHTLVMQFQFAFFAYNVPSWLMSPLPSQALVGWSLWPAQ